MIVFNATELGREASRWKGGREGAAGTETHSTPYIYHTSKISQVSFLTFPISMTGTFLLGPDFRKKSLIVGAPHPHRNFASAARYKTPRPQQGQRLLFHKGEGPWEAAGSSTKLLLTEMAGKRRKRVVQSETKGGRIFTINGGGL